MSAYLTLFKCKFMLNLQYRMAAISGIITQFVWGYLLIILYQLFSITSWTNQEIATYFWLNQAFLSLNALWTMDTSIFQDIQRGDIQYDCVRPLNIYVKWFVTNLSHRLARTLLRAIPLLLVTLLLPYPFTLLLPTTFINLCGFTIALIGALLTQCAVGNIMYILALILKQDMGVRILFSAMFDLLDGGNIPYFYFPKPFATGLQYTFFFSVKSAPFLIYLGLMPIMQTLLIQTVWLVLLILMGYTLMKHQLKRMEVYGG